MSVATDKPTLVASGSSANIFYYGEADQHKPGRIWCSVLCSTLVFQRGERNEHGQYTSTTVTTKATPDYYFTVYRQGDGEIGRFEYHPQRRPNPLALRDRTVTRLVRQFLAARA
jgi:hypothetical protein